MSTTLLKGGGVLLFVFVDADWHASCQALFQGIDEEDWEELCDAYKGMSRAVRSQEATGGPESKSPLEIEGSQRCRRRILRSHA